MNLANALCKNREDDLYFADCLWKNGGFFRKHAAEIYLRHGREDRYIEYLMQSLAKDTAAYEKAIRYFQSTGKREMAVEVAKIGLEKCKYDQTIIYCTLVEDALMRDDQKLDRIAEVMIKYPYNYIKGVPGLDRSEDCHSESPREGFCFGSLFISYLSVKRLSGDRRKEEGIFNVFDD